MFIEARLKKERVEETWPPKMSENLDLNRDLTSIMSLFTLDASVIYQLSSQQTIAL
jgi:hypothetical protein